MKKIITLLLLLTTHQWLTAQNVGISTTEPVNKLQVHGNILVTAPTIATTTAPTGAQTKTMLNASTISYMFSDSTGRIYDPGGPAGNYVANLTANTSIPGSINSGFEITVESMDLATGDSLIIKESISGPVLLAVGNGYIATGKWVFASSSLYIVFKSNADANVGAGFSLLFLRLYDNSSSLPNVSGFSGKSLFFNTKNGAFRSGLLNNSVQGNYSTATGYSTTASGIGSTAMGYVTSASGNYSTAMGFSTTASGVSSTAMGNGTSASGYNSTASGYYTNATAYYSTATGLGTTASGDYSNAMGYNTTASAEYSIAMGHSTIASGGNSTAMGRSTTAVGDFSTAMGKGTNAFGISSTAMGFQTGASGDFSTTMGYSTTASSYASTAMGFQTGANGIYSTAMGYGTIATGDYSTSMGNGTIASGDYSTAIGHLTTASGYKSSTLGYQTVSRGYAGTVLGMYNDPVLATAETNISATTPLFIIGNGDFNALSNAMYVMKNGNVGLGNTVPISTLHIKHPGNATGGLTLENAIDGNKWRLFSASGDNNLSFFNNAGTEIADIDDVTGTFSALSDSRYKKQVENMAAVLPALMKLKPKYYQFNWQQPGDQRQIGMLAQETYTLFPELVSYNKQDDIYKMNYAGFSTVAIKAIQEQQLMIETLIKRIEKLEALLK